MVSLINDGDGMTNIEIEKKAKQLKLPNFNYFMRDQLPNKAPNEIECGVVNLDDSSGMGTHHVCYWKNGRNKYYFDSFGVVPPFEVIKYLLSPILYSTYQIQSAKDTNCSEICLYVLNELNKGKNYSDIVLNLATNIEKNKNL